MPFFARVGRYCRRPPAPAAPASPPPPGTWARSGSVSATISRRTAGSSAHGAHTPGPYGLDGQLGQDGDAEARAHQPDHRRIVVGREVDARGEAGPLAHLDQLAAAARAARDPGLLGEFPDGDGLRAFASRCRSGTRATSRSVSRGRTTRSSHSSAPAAPSYRKASATSQSPSRSRPTECGRFGLLQGDAGAGVRGAQGGEGRRDEGGAAAGEGDEPDPARPAARRWRRPPPRRR